MKEISRMTANDVLNWLQWGSIYGHISNITTNGVDSHITIYSAMRMIECLENTRQRLLYPCRKCTFMPNRNRAEPPWLCHQCRNFLCEDRSDALSFGVADMNEDLKVRPMDDPWVQKFDEDELIHYLEMLQKCTYQKMNETWTVCQMENGYVALALSYAIVAAKRTKEVREWLERRCEPDRYSSCSTTYNNIAKCLQWWRTDWEPYSEE